MLSAKPPMIASIIMMQTSLCRRQKLVEREEFTKSKASSSLLSDDSSDLAGVRYRPKTRETKSTYEVLLSFIQAAIGDQVTAHVVTVLSCFNTGLSLRAVACDTCYSSACLICTRYRWTCLLLKEFNPGYKCAIQNLMTACSAVKTFALNLLL